MKRLAYLVTLLLCVAGSIVYADNNQSWWNTQNNTTEGTDFWATFMTNSGAYSADVNDLDLYLYVTSRQNATVVIQNPNYPNRRITETITAGGQKQIKIPTALAYLTDNDIVSRKGIHITSDNPVSVYATSHHNSGKYDGTNILPTEALMGEYVVQTYTSDQYSTEFAIVAIENNTLITGEIKRTEENGNQTSTPFRKTLNAGETYLYRSAATGQGSTTGLTISLSGSHFCSSKPFALFQGGQSAKIPQEPENHIFHQAYPTDMWGKTFVVTPTYYAVYDYVQITVAENNTQIFRDGTLVKTLNAFETYIDTITSRKIKQNQQITYTPTIAVYTTSKSSTCFLYGTGKEVNGAFVGEDQILYDLGSPVLTAIVPQEYGMKSCIFATFNNIISGSGATMNHYVNIVTSTNEVSGMYMDNQSIASDFVPCPTDASYSYTIKNISDNAHLLENRNDNANSTFTARVYGLGKTSSTAESYAYAAGCRINRSANLLVNHEYKTEEDICITDNIIFTPIIQYDFERYKLDYVWRSGVTATTNSGWQTDIHDIEKQFPDTGLWETDLVIQRKTPVCDYGYYDTVRVNIYVHDTTLLDYGYNDGATPNICYGEEFDVHYNNGQKFHYKADTTTLQEIFGANTRFELNKTYTFVDSLISQWGCDSVIRQSVCIRPTHYKLIYDTICQKNTPYTYIDTDNGRANTGKLSNLYSSGHYIDSLQTRYGCDSILELYLTVNPDYEIDTTRQICSNQDIWWQGHHYVGENYPNRQPTDIVVPVNKPYQDSLHFWTSDEYHCDSILTFHLTIVDTFIVSLNYSTCVHVPIEVDFDTDKFPTYTVDKVGQQVYVDSLLSQAGCDSIVQMTLNVLPRYDLFMTDTICQEHNGVYDWQGHTHLYDSIAGRYVPKITLDRSGWHTYIDSLQTTEGGCDSIWTLRLYVAPIYAIAETHTICDNDSLHWRGRILAGSKAPQIYKDEADWVFGGGTHIGADTVHYTTVLGCDSMYMLNLRVDTTTATYLNCHHCTSEKSVEYEHTRFDISYIHTIDTTFHYSTAFHCDSAVVYHIVVDSAYYFTEYDTICQNSPYKWLNHNVATATTTAGDMTYYDRLHTVAGCDSVFTLHLRVNPVYRIDEGELHLCDNDTVRWQGRLYAGEHTSESVRQSAYKVLPYKAGGYLDSIRYDSQYGCDSLRYVTLVVDTTTVTRLSYHHCTSEKSVEYEHTRFDISYIHTIDTTFHYSTAFHCDSAVVYHIVVDSAYYFTEYDTICQNAPYNWLNHNVSVATTTAGDMTYYDRLHTVAGCDSVFTLHLRVNPVYRINEGKLHLCDNDTVRWQGRLYAGEHTSESVRQSAYKVLPYKAGGYLDSIRYDSQYGCDSLRYVTLVVDTTTVTRLSYHHCTSEKSVEYEHTRFDISYIHTIDTTFHYSTAFHCDSAVVYHIVVDSAYYFTEYDTICQNSPYKWLNHNVATATTTAGDMTYYDRLHTVAGCDSVFTLHLRVNPIYWYGDTLTMSDEESRKWEHTVYVGSKVNTDTLSKQWYEPELSQGMARPKVVVVPAGQIRNHYDTVYQTIHGCDSTRALYLLVGPTYRDTIVRWTCDNEPYHWYHTDADAAAGREARTDLTLLTPQLYYDSLKTKEFGFDSIYVLDLRNYPTYHFSKQDTVCQGVPYAWEGHTESARIYSVQAHDWIDIDKIPTDVPGRYTYIDSLKTKEPPTHTDQTLNHGCDSVWTLDLLVPPSYYYDTVLTICDNDTVSWQHILFAGDKFEAFHHTYDAALYDSVKVYSAAGADEVGEYKETVHHETAVFGCDSVYRAVIRISPTFYSEQEREVCQYDDATYEAMGNGIGGVVPTDVAATLEYYDTIASLRPNACDSVIHMIYHVWPVYSYVQHDTICQDTISTEYIWSDEFGGDHSRVSISIARPGDYSYADTLKTVHGCDSVFGMHLHVSPIYRFDSLYTICDNEATTWQGKRYVGYKFADIHLTDVVVRPGLHRDTAYYLTQEYCDSTYYLALDVHPTFDTIAYIHSCRNEDFDWVQTDHNGSYTDHLWDSRYVDTIRITTDMSSVPLPQYARAADTIRAERMLQTIYDCDSLSHIELTIHPAYFFYSDTTICSNEKILWRGRYFSSQDTICTDSLTTRYGCDSIYQLRLHIQPSYLFHLTYELCDNETLYHDDNHIEVVWAPGNPIADYTELFYYTQAGCDSIYRYYLNIHPTYYLEDSITLCSNEDYAFHVDHLIHLDREYDMQVAIAPIDTIITDSLSTVYGCDSVFRLKAHIVPAYRHIDYDTICDNGSVLWRGQSIQSPAYGDYVYWDSLQTKAGCDSVYELRLKVWPTYFYESHDSICADEVFDFNGRSLNESGFYSDSLVTMHGCDSVYHLYLTVLDTTYEVRVDTICYGETYLLHDRPITVGGFYKDTTLNEWGCHHFTYLTLTFTEPTIAHLMADSVCMDKDAFELGYWYEGTSPIAYSLLFDDFGHEQGFEDQRYVAFDGDSVVLLPMPQRTLDDPTQYPRPDHYPVKLVLHNGLCLNDSLYPSTADIIMNYPSWVTEQRFRDVIAILDTKYNGGYEFTSFQWFCNGQPMPGETHEYLYLPHEMTVDTVDYYVRVTRPGESESFQTCPIRIYPDAVDTLAPNLPYISVVPTYVSREHPVVNILSVNRGHYKVFTSTGALFKSGEIIPDEHHAMEVELDPTQGNMFMFYLRDDETIYSEKERVIKVTVQ